MPVTIGRPPARACDENPLAGPDPECVMGHGERLLVSRGAEPIPRPSVDMSKRTR